MGLCVSKENSKFLDEGTEFHSRGINFIFFKYFEFPLCSLRFFFSSPLKPKTSKNAELSHQPLFRYLSLFHT